jgi:hypothetical protein
VIDHFAVIPAEAGIQTNLLPVAMAAWIPAFAGMTGDAAAAVL